jgi:uncharacterized protein (TIGR02246 family)
MMTETPAAETASAPAQADDPRSADEAAIRRVVAAVQEGWNTLDGNGFADPFADDADYVIINGMHIKGRDVIAAGHQQIFDTIYKDSRLICTIQSSRFLRDDIALVHVSGHVTFRQGDLEHVSNSMITMVMSKENERWSIAAFHNTPVVAREAE